MVLGCFGHQRNGSVPPFDCLQVQRGELGELRDQNSVDHRLWCCRRLRCGNYLNTGCGHSQGRSCVVHKGFDPLFFRQHSIPVHVHSVEGIMIIMFAKLCRALAVEVFRGTATSCFSPLEPHLFST